MLYNRELNVCKLYKEPALTASAVQFRITLTQRYIGRQSSNRRSVCYVASKQHIYSRACKASIQSSVISSYHAFVSAQAFAALSIVEWPPPLCYSR